MNVSNKITNTLRIVAIVLLIVSSSIRLKFTLDTMDYKRRQSNGGNI